MEVMIVAPDIRKFVLKLSVETRMKVARVIETLEENGYEIGIPASKSLHNGLFELRTMGKIQVRLLYCFHENKAYILHAIVKKTDEIPLKDLYLAQKRRMLLS